MTDPSKAGVIANLERNANLSGIWGGVGVNARQIGNLIADNFDKGIFSTRLAHYLAVRS